jgi:hypothetical protein
VPVSEVSLVDNASVMTFEAGKPWPAITKALRSAGPRYAAVAYVASGADELMPLRAGDVLVANIGDAAMASRATSPAVIRTFLDRGVDVYSLERLHAKVMATRRLAVIGSANASVNSATNVDEAVVITDDQATIEQVRAFVQSLDLAVPVTPEFLDAQQAKWEDGRHSGVPGHQGTRIIEPPYIPGHGRMFVQETIWGSWTQAGEELFEKERRRVRKARGPASRYALESLILAPHDPPLARDDICVEVFHERGRAWVYPPAVVISEPTPVPRSRGKQMVLLRRRIDLKELSLGMATASVRAARVPVRTPFFEHRVTSKKERQTILDLWALADGV